MDWFKVALLLVCIHVLALISTLIVASNLKSPKWLRLQDRLGRIFVTLLVLLPATSVSAVIVENQVSKQAGFETPQDWHTAEKFGISDPNLWMIRKAELQTEADQIAYQQAADILAAQRNASDRCRQDSRCYTKPV